MDKVIVDPGKIIEGPGRGGPPEFAKVEIGEGWPSKWIGLEEADGVPEDALKLLSALDDGNVEGLLLPAVQAADHMPFTFIKIAQEDSDAFDRLVNDEQGPLDEFDDLLVLDPEGEQAAGFLKIGDIKGEAQETPDMGAWTPLSDFSDADMF